MLFYAGLVILLCIAEPASLNTQHGSSTGTRGSKTSMSPYLTDKASKEIDHKPLTNAMDPEVKPTLDETQSNTSGFDVPNSDSDAISVELLDQPKVSEVVAAVDANEEDKSGGTYAKDKLAEEKAIIFAGCAGGMLVLCIIGFIAFKRFGRRRTPRTNEFEDYAYGAAPT